MRPTKLFDRPCESNRTFRTNRRNRHNLQPLASSLSLSLHQDTRMEHPLQSSLPKFPMATVRCCLLDYHCGPLGCS
jgi:hypothetical protein